MAADDSWPWFAARRSRRLVERWDAPLAPSFLATRGAALALSALVHGSVVAVAFEQASSRAHSVAARPAERSIELDADDLALLAPDLIPAPLAVPAPLPSEVARVAAPHAVTARAASTPAEVPAMDARPSPAAEPAVGAAQSVVAAPEPRAPRFVMAAPPLALGGPSAPAATAAPTAASSALASSPLDEHAVDVPARLVAGTAPAYPPSAEAAGVEANVPVELVVAADGSVRSAVALAHVGYGLDESALEAVRHYRFAPARRAGAAVTVRMRWVVRFELR